MEEFQTFFFFAAPVKERNIELNVYVTFTQNGIEKKPNKI